MRTGALQHPFNPAEGGPRYRRRMRGALTTGAGTLLSALALAVPAHAATLTVESRADSGPGSLRTAIAEANASPGADRIGFAPSLVGSIELKSALPTITAPVSIEGPGAGALSLHGDGTSGLLSIDLAEAGEVNVAGLTLSGGVAEAGGAIAGTDADLILDHLVLSGNRASGEGGALALRGGTLTLLSSKLVGNRAWLAGGALSVREAGLNLASSTLARNVAGGDGGGLSIAAPSGGLLVEGARLLDNRSGADGGAISVAGSPKKPLSVSDSRLVGNRAAGRGGALFAAAGVPPSLEGTTVEGNSGSPAVVRPKAVAKPTHPSRPLHLPPATAGTNGSWSPTAADSRLASILAQPLGVPGATAAGDSATLLGDVALAPADAPPAIQAVIAAANQISHTPYIWGGGHGSWWSPGYDCSGAVSFALHGGGFLSTPLASGQLESWGAPGPGRWLTVYANAGHAYAVIAGLRWDTVGDASGTGPRWHLGGAYPEGFVARHPPGY